MEKSKLLILCYITLLSHICFAQLSDENKSDAVINVGTNNTKIIQPKDTVPDNSSEKTSGDFVVLNSGEKLYGEIERNVKFFKGEFVELNGSEIPRHNIFAFQDGLKYYRLLPDGMFGELAFAERIQKGKINLFKVIRPGTPGHFVQKPGHTINTPHGSFTTPGTSHYVGGSGPQKVLYYAKGNNEIKRAYISNLRVDLSDNPKSIKLLNKRAGFMGAAYSLTGIGLIMVISGVVKNDIGESGLPPSASIGVGLAITGSVMSFLIPDFKEEAISIYNE